MKKLTARTTEFLKELPYFRALHADAFRRLLDGAAEIKLPRHAILRRRGDICHALHIVIKGRIKLSLETSQGNEKVIALLGPRARIGDALVFSGKPSLSTVEALEDSELACISRNTLLDELSRNSQFAMSVIEEMSRRVYQRTRDIESYTLRNGTERLIEYLLGDEPEVAINGVRHVILSERKGIIASRLNLTQEHFSRVLRDLVERGLLRVDGAHVLIPDVEQLRGLLA